MENIIPNIIIYAFVFIFGVSIGSFLNVCIYRLPLNESLTKRNSHCMTCGEYIKRKDLIPIISWCLLKGKCRACGAKISPRYTIVEALNGVLYVLVFLRFKAVENLTYMGGIQMLIIAVTTCIAFSALVVIFFMDWDTQLINDGVVAVIAVMAIPKYFAEQSYMNLNLQNTSFEFPDLKSHIIGLFAASVPLLLIVLISRERAMGYGDVTLMAASGLFLGLKSTLVALFIGFIAGAIGGLIIKHIKQESQCAFGPFLSIGVAVAALFGNQLGDLYISFTGLDKTLEMVRVIF